MDFFETIKELEEKKQMYDFFSPKVNSKPNVNKNKKIKPLEPPPLVTYTDNNKKLKKINLNKGGYVSIQDMEKNLK